MTRRNLILILAATTALSALALSAARARDVPKVATGFVANMLCSETFVSGQPPAADVRRNHGGDARRRADHLGASSYQVDRARKDVTVTLFGLGKSHAVYRARDLAAISITAMRSPISRCRRRDAKRRSCCCLTSPVPSMVAPANAATGRGARSRLCRAGQAAAAPHRAMVVVKDGRVVAERYAEGTASIRRCSASPRPSR